MLPCRSARGAGLVVGAVLVLAGCLDDPLVESAPEVVFVDVTTGRAHACGLADSGDVYCWTRFDPRPRLVSGGVELTSISTYWDHSCGVGEDGRAYCWGMNYVGQLGVSAEDLAACRNGADTVPCTDRPLPVSGDLRFVAVDAGAAHSCGITVSGEAWCWGANGAGQLGTSAATCDPTLVPEGFLCATVPTAVAGGQRYVAISAGRAHTCAIDDAGTAWCWGAGGEGRLGSGSKLSQPEPGAVLGALQFTSIAAGGSHTCAVTADAVPYCWGSNSDLQIGTPETDATCGIHIFKCFLVPTPVNTDLDVTAMAASDGVNAGGFGPPIGGHSCAITMGGLVYCWGLNTSGQLMNSGDLRSAVPVLVSREERFERISAGQENTCGLTADGGILCWAFGGPVSRWVVFPGE